MKTVVGLYDTFTEARQVVEELANNGFDRDEISIVANNAAGDVVTHSASDTSEGGEDVTAGEGAGMGAIEGGVIGLIAGLGALAIPGLGAVAVAGPLLGALTGAGVGAATGGLVAGLVDSGIPDDIAGHYSEGVRRGGTLVSVHTSDDRAQAAAGIMNRYGAIDVEERAGTWGQSGYKGYDVNAQPYSADQINTERQTYSSSSTATKHDTGTTRNVEGEVRLPVVEEEIKIGKRAVEGGGVRIHSRVEQIPVEEEVTLRQERVVVDRRPVDRAATEADLTNLPEGTLEVTERSEQAVVAKEARVVEEVVVGKQVEQHTETIRDSVRRTDVEVEQVETANVRTADFTTYDTDFRNDFKTNYASRGQAYDRYQPAYKYGYTLASNPSYRGRSWNDIETEARRGWNTSQGPWDDFKDSVRYAWNRVTNG